MSSRWGRSCLTSRLRTSPMSAFFFADSAKASAFPLVVRDGTWGHSLQQRAWSARLHCRILGVLQALWAKMANMSTVASSVAYRPHKLIDITANMFINDSAYQSVIELFDQLRGACKPCGQHLRRVWLLLKRLQYSFLPFFDHRPGRG